MPGIWAITPDESSYGTVRGTTGMQLDRCVAEAGGTDLGGGLMRFTADDRLGPWTLTYDEVFYMIAGELTIETEDETIRLGPGRIGLIAAGTTVIYRGVEGTTAFYSVTPREWKPAGEPLEVGDGR